jgi:hypothetical protein
VDRREVIQNRIDRLVADFGRYVEAYDRLVSFSGDQLAAHRETIALRRDARSVEAAIGDARFVSSLRRTLRAWGIGGRASVLLPQDEFIEALRSAAPGLKWFQPFTIDAVDLPADTADRLWFVIDRLGVVENKAKLVAGTKTLHHLLPDLVVPMDRVWTGKFFRLHPPEWQEPTNQHKTFRRVYAQLADIARQTDPQQYVTGQGWRTSQTKILDNALIGFCKVELDGRSPATDRTVNTISFQIPGHPPAKNEAQSIFGAGHPHVPRVRLLLDTARCALQQEDFTPITKGPVGLDVIVHAPAGQEPWDATNYLGGIADVLEDKSRRGTLDHLGDLTSTWLYRNDRQIKEITYRQTPSAHLSYTVTVRALTPIQATPAAARPSGTADVKSTRRT